VVKFRRTPRGTDPAQETENRHFIFMRISALIKTQREQGWSLAEVMVAVAVLAILLVSLFSGFALSFNLIRTTREDLRATQILTQKIEGIRLCTWKQLTNECPSTFQDTYTSLGNTNSSKLVYYGTISQSFNTNLPSGYRDKVKLITVTVTWTTSRAGATHNSVVHSRSMQTQSAYYGLQNYLYGVTNSI
jgi:prepilin-type N-terminal cleavage/methylation domain-containing protein